MAITVAMRTQVSQLYVALFGRAPDSEGLAYWVNELNTGKTVVQVANAMYAVDPARPYYPLWLTNEEVVRSFYVNVLGRQPDADGLAFWTGKLNAADAANSATAKGVVLAEIISVVANYTGTDPAGLASQALFNNKVAVAQYYGEHGGNIDLADDALAGVTANAATVVAAKAAIDAGTLGAPAPAPEPTYDVTPSAGSVNEGDTVVFTITTEHVAAGTVLSYTLSGTATAADLDGSAVAGTVTIDASGQAVVAVKLAADHTTEGNEILSFNLGAGLAATSVTVADTSTTPVTPPPPAPVSQTLVATTGIDVLTGDAADDRFLATQATLQNGDEFHGAAGNDRLEIAITGNTSASYYDGFKTSSVETISVKNLGYGGVSLDVSDVGYDTANGRVTLESRETDDSAVEFWDIQSINNTDIRIIDTDEDHRYVYDAGNSAENDNGTGAGGDEANIAISEMRGTAPVGTNWYSGLGNGRTGNDGARAGVVGASITLANNYNDGELVESYVDRIRLTSGISGQVTDTQKNTIQLTAGEDLDTLIISGDADLEVTNVLDPNIRLVDASAHQANAEGRFNGSNTDLRADLILNLSNSSDDALYAEGDAFWTDDANLDGYVSGDPEDQRQGLVRELTVKGSQGDDLITFGTTHNDKLVSLNDGNDTLVAAGWAADPRFGHPYSSQVEVLVGGEASINAGDGNDVITTGIHNDIVIAGEGNDNIVDGGSTANLQAKSENSRLPKYTPDYSLLGNQFDLGNGNDTLTVLTSSNNTIDAGNGNDVIAVAGDAVDGSQAAPDAWNDVVTYVSLGSGNDAFSIGNEGEDGLWGGSRGNVSVTGGEGNDTIDIDRDGNQTVDAGEGNDHVEIHQDQNEFSDHHFDGTARDGNHKVTLGAGDDYLWITGRSEVAVAGKTTDIDAGTGNDRVEIEQDHRLNVKLGEGNDVLQLRAQDLQSNDTIQGGDNYLTDSVNGYDTIELTNESRQEFYGEVRDSETRHVFAIEQFNLYDENIRLHITDNLVDTALNKTVVVDTTGSGRVGEFPIDLRVGETQGMLWSEWVRLFRNVEIPGLNHERTPDPAFPTDSTKDLMFAYYENATPQQTVDLTKLNTVDYTFVLNGGGLRDIVVVDEDAISADLHLNFDSAGDVGEGWDQTDTLQVVDGANIRAADLENVNDLEIIELVASQNIAQTWVVELNNHVINQPTALEPLVIRIDPNVPAGSKVYVVFSENNTNLATNDVIVERNANVQVYIVTDQGALDWDAFLAHEDQYNTDVPAWHFNGSGHKVVVKTAQYFTDNTDNLVGTGTNDTFIAQTIDQINTSDSVNGNGGEDTVELRFAVANANESLSDQLEWAALTSVERLVFNTENRVAFDTIDYGDEDPFFWADSLTTIETGNSSDSLTNVERSGMFFRLHRGNDYISFDGSYNAQRGNLYETIEGGAGIDSVEGSDASNDIYSLGSVEYVTGGSGEDVFSYTAAGGNDGNITVNGGIGNDTLNLDQDGTNGVAYVTDVEDINGGSGADSIDATRSDVGMIDVSGGANNDWLNVHTNNASTFLISGGSGNDTIVADNVGGTVTANGDSGADVISVGSNTPGFVTVNGGSGSDTITVYADTVASVHGDADADLITVQSDITAEVWGDEGADTISVNVSGNASVWGGAGNDTIDVTDSGTGSGSASHVWGNDGNDTINVHGSSDFVINGGSDNGNDVINLQALGGGVDTIVFGDVGYDSQQAKNVDSQGVDIINNFNFENGPGPDVGQPGPDDVLDFTAFLTGSKATDDFNGFLGGLNTAAAVKYDDWTGGANNLDLDNLAGSVPDAKIAVITVNNAFSAQDLRNAVFLEGGSPAGIEMNDGARTVVILAKDSDASDAIVGYDKFEVYYVQDIDTSSSSAVWAVDLVATINSTTAVGSIQGSIGVNQFNW